MNLRIRKILLLCISHRTDSIWTRLSGILKKESCRKVQDDFLSRTVEINSRIVGERQKLLDQGVSLDVIDEDVPLIILIKYLSEEDESDNTTSYYVCSDHSD